MKKLNSIRHHQTRVFTTCTTRALLILNAEDNKLGSLADACRLIETALKAAESLTAIDHNRRDPESADSFISDISRGFAEHKNAQTENP